MIWREVSKELLDLLHGIYVYRKRDDPVEVSDYITERLQTLINRIERDEPLEKG